MTIGEYIDGIIRGSRDLGLMIKAFRVVVWKGDVLRVETTWQDDSERFFSNDSGACEIERCKFDLAKNDCERAAHAFKTAAAVASPGR